MEYASYSKPLTEQHVRVMEKSMKTVFGRLGGRQLGACAFEVLGSTAHRLCDSGWLTSSWSAVSHSSNETEPTRDLM